MRPICINIIGRPCILLVRDLMIEIRVYNRLIRVYISACVISCGIQTWSWICRGTVRCVPVDTQLPGILLRCIQCTVTWGLANSGRSIIGRRINILLWIVFSTICMVHLTINLPCILQDNDTRSRESEQQTCTSNWIDNACSSCKKSSCIKTLDTLSTPNFS